MVAGSSNNGICKSSLQYHGMVFFGLCGLLAAGATCAEELASASWVGAQWVLRGNREASLWSIL
eukprot:8022741-Prorocentrum_lima.AAC.1